MLISLKHGYVFLCMPKCASTSTESCLRKQSEIRISGHPALKHTNFRDYKRFVFPFLEHQVGEVANRLEVVCLFRHPISWLDSHYRFRLKEALLKRRGRTGTRARDLTFQEFLDRYVSGSRGPAIGRQVDRILDSHGQVGNVRLFRYESYDKFIDYMSTKVSRQISTTKKNVSPGAPVDVAEYSRYLIHPKIAPDWKVYQEIPV